MSHMDWIKGLKILQSLCITVLGDFFPCLEAEHISHEFLQPSQRNINHLHSLHLATLSNVNWRAWEIQESSLGFPMLWLLCRMCGWTSESLGSGWWSKLSRGWAPGWALLPTKAVGRPVLFPASIYFLGEVYHMFFLKLVLDKTNCLALKGLSVLWSG